MVHACTRYLPQNVTSQHSNRLLNCWRTPRQVWRHLPFPVSPCSSASCCAVCAVHREALCMLQSCAAHHSWSTIFCNTNVSNKRHFSFWLQMIFFKIEANAHTFFLQLIKVQIILPIIIPFRLRFVFERHYCFKIPQVTTQIHAANSLHTVVLNIWKFSIGNFSSPKLKIMSLSKQKTASIVTQVTTPCMSMLLAK